MRTIEMKLNPETGVYEADLTPAIPGDDLSARSAGGILGQVTDFEFQGIPIGAAIVGSAGAGIGDLLSRFVEPILPRLGVLTPGMRRALILALAAWAVQTGPVKNVLGSQGSTAAALILTVDGVITFFNARRLVGGLLSGSIGALTGASGQRSANGQPADVRDATPARAFTFGL